MANCSDSWAKLKQTHKRLEKCWEIDINWSLYPEALKEGCFKVGKALNLPATAVLSGYLILGSFILSPASIKVPGTNWEEPVLLWLTVSMPTGTGKSTLFRHLYDIMRNVRTLSGVKDDDPAWILDDATFEKMGALMEENASRLLGFYDELSTFLTQINLYRGRSLSDSHELSLFLQLFNGHPWRRDTVGGEANFVMASTRLTIGGFTQAGVARNIIDMPNNSEKGLSHRFLWVFPKPLYGKFASLGELDKTFIDDLSRLLSRQWRKCPARTELPTRIFNLQSREGQNSPGAFEQYYDEIQGNLEKISGMDEFLSGMISKSRGQVLRLAAILHVLFTIDQPSDYSDGVSETVSEESVKAAIDFIKVSCQQVAFISGREKIEDELEKYTNEEFVQTPDNIPADDITAAHCLTLPGKHLYLTPLLAAKKFRKKGNKEGAVRAFNQLQEEGLGKTLILGSSKGAVQGTFSKGQVNIQSLIDAWATKLTIEQGADFKLIPQQFEFEKAKYPEDAEEAVKLAFKKKLQKYCVSLPQYIAAYNQPGMKPTKRVLSFDGENCESTRKSARLTPLKTP